MALRYGIESNVEGYDYTHDELDWMRFQIIGWQENEDNDALTESAIRYRSWLAIDYNHLTPGRTHHTGSRFSRTSNAPQGLGLSYNFGPDGQSQNIIEVNAGGCLTRINLNPAITINNSTQYQHTQTIAASTWIINHNLGFVPNVFTIDVNGIEIEGVVETQGLNIIHIIFSEPVAGYAYLS